MFGNLLGVPLAFIVFLATDHYLHEWDWIGDRLAIDALGVCLGLCAMFSVKGIDILLNQKKDNPPPFIVPKPVPEAFGTIKQLFSEASYGPFFWGLKSVDPEANRIVAVMNFTELMGPGVLSPPIQAQRLMMVQVLVDPVAESEQQPLYPILSDSEKGITQIQLNWRIDSPMNRLTVNKIMDEATAAIQESLGLPGKEKPQPKSPFEPPQWLLVLTMIAVLFCVQRSEQYGEFKTQREAERKARQVQIEQEKTQREEAARKAIEAEAAREAYNKEMADKFKEAQEEQRRKADELLQQERDRLNNNQYTPPYTKPYSNPFAEPLNPGGSLYRNPFKREPTSPFSSPQTPDQGTDGGSPSWRAPYGGSR